MGDIGSDSCSRALLSGSNIILGRANISRGDVHVIGRNVRVLNTELPTFGDLPMGITTGANATRDGTGIDNGVIANLGNFVVSFTPTSSPRVTIYITVRGLGDNSTATSLITRVCGTCFRASNNDIGATRNCNSLLN